MIATLSSNDGFERPLLFDPLETLPVRPRGPTTDGRIFWATEQSLLGTVHCLIKTAVLSPQEATERMNRPYNSKLVIFRMLPDIELVGGVTEYSSPAMEAFEAHCPWGEYAQILKGRRERWGTIVHPMSARLASLNLWTYKLVLRNKGLYEIPKMRSV